jgi:hypothetical protein
MSQPVGMRKECWDRREQGKALFQWIRKESRISSILAQGGPFLSVCADLFCLLDYSVHVPGFLCQGIVI